MSPGGSHATAKRRPRLSKKYLRIVGLYRHFARHWAHCLDFSDHALHALYEYESTGKGCVASDNGYAHGKKMADVNVAMWREDLWFTLHPQELLDDPDLPDWWLCKVLGLPEPPGPQ